MTQSGNIYIMYSGRYACAVSCEVWPGAKIIHIFFKSLSQGCLFTLSLIYRALPRTCIHVMGDK